MSKRVGIGMIGGGFMAKAHTFAYKVIPMLWHPPAAIPSLEIIAEKDESLAKHAAERLGYKRSSGDWRSVVNANSVDVVDIVAPNYMHAEIAIHAAQAGKAIFCEKPLGLDGKQARQMYEQVKQLGVIHGVNFCYRKVPAVSYAKKLIREQKIGKIYHFRAMYACDAFADPQTPITWRLRKKIAGSGAIGDIGSHIIDLARYLVGEFKRVTGYAKTFVRERPCSENTLGVSIAVGKDKSNEEKVDVDDAGGCVAELEGGTTGVFEATYLAHGRKNFLAFEVYGDKGAILFNYSRMNELKIFLKDDLPPLAGFRTVLTGPVHPYGEAWWPAAGFGVGYEACIANNIRDFLWGVAACQQVSPNFYDGWKANAVCDALLLSAAKQKWMKL